MQNWELGAIGGAVIGGFEYIKTVSQDKTEKFDSNKLGITILAGACVGLGTDVLGQSPDQTYVQIQAVAFQIAQWGGVAFIAQNIGKTVLSVLKNVQNPPSQPATPTQ